MSKKLIFDVLDPSTPTTHDKVKRLADLFREQVESAFIDEDLSNYWLGMIDIITDKRRWEDNVPERIKSLFSERGSDARGARTVQMYDTQELIQKVIDIAIQMKSGKWTDDDEFKQLKKKYDDHHIGCESPQAYFKRYERNLKNTQATYSFKPLINENEIGIAARASGRSPEEVQKLILENNKLPKDTVIANFERKLQIKVKDASALYKGVMYSSYQYIVDVLTDEQNITSSEATKLCNSAIRSISQPDFIAAAKKALEKANHT